MSLNLVSYGADAPNTFNVIIEIPMNADPIKYEVETETGAIGHYTCAFAAWRCGDLPRNWHFENGG